MNSNQSESKGIKGDGESKGTHPFDLKRQHSCSVCTSEVTITSCASAFPAESGNETDPPALHGLRRGSSNNRTQDKTSEKPLDIVLYLFQSKMMDDYRTIHWTRAVEINHIALTRIVAEIFALLGLVSGSSFDRLPQALYRSVERLLRPTESALRRLIVIAARGLVLKPLPKRPMPKDLKIARKAAGPKVSRLTSFRLFDTRKSFDFIQPENPDFVYVKTYSSNPFNPFEHFRRQYPAQPEKQDSSVNAIKLIRRLAAVKHALETIPRQAQRMARWQAQRKMMEKPKFTSPLRPGPPPGHRQKPKLDVDFVLRECHGLAWDALREAPS